MRTKGCELRHLSNMSKSGLACYTAFICPPATRPTFQGYFLPGKACKTPGYSSLPFFSIVWEESSLPGLSQLDSTLWLGAVWAVLKNSFRLSTVSLLSA